ncbi:MAG: TonB-dependent receptor [Bacteroidales bacterium]|nr:TonB-dependent receptor [Bacteroidales bacterium]
MAYLGVSGGLKLSDKIKNMSSDDFSEYSRQKDPFKTSFSIEKSTALPELSLEVGAGKSWKVGRQKLNAMVAANFSNEYVLYEDAYTSLMNAQGVIRERFNYNQYLYETTLTTLGQISYSLRDNDMLSYNIMYVNNTEDIYRKRDGMDAEGKDLIGSNSIYHIYSLLNNQLTGKHQFFGRLFTDWQFSYGRTTSDEPDRRQVMFEKNNDGSLSLFKLNQQETMRYFGELFEDEWNGELKAKYNLNKSDTPDFIRVGVSLRDKSRDFYSANFYYDVKNIYPTVTDVYDMDGYLNSENLMNGSITIDKNSQRRNKYYADAKIAAGFINFEYYPIKNLLISGGVRYEHSKHSVDYWTDGGSPEKAKLDANDFFPALSLKYTLNGSRNLRLSVSRTITRPSFLEMAPFEYQELYGGITSRGFADIKNGYNTNIDLRYEYFNKEGDMFSLGAYYKHLEDAIENILEYSGSLIQSFRNVDKGVAAGVELEVRKKLTKELKVDFNASYIYTHISLPEGGTYTDRSRALQGASPYLINMDVNYAPKFRNEREGSFSLVYNVQGPRISSVGIGGVNNVMEETFHSLDFVGTYSLNSRMKLKFQAKNLINQKQKFSQKVADTGKKETVEYYKKGLSLGIGFSMDF